MIDVLQVYDPSLRIAVNNEMGSDPNSLPEFYIRGRSGVGVMELDKDAVSQSALSNNPNTPILLWMVLRYLCRKCMTLTLTV